MNFLVVKDTLIEMDTITGVEKIDVIKGRKSKYLIKVSQDVYGVSWTFTYSSYKERDKDFNDIRFKLQLR